MKFVHTVINSLTKPDFYASVIRGEKKLGFGFVLKIQVIAALFLTIILSISISSALPFFDNFARTVLPKGAEIIVKDGKLETNANPIVIPFVNKSGERATSSPLVVKNIVVLDVTASTTPAELQRKDTLILITEEGIIVRNDAGRFSTTMFRNIQNLDVSIDEQLLIDKVGWAKGIARFAPFIIFVFILASLYVGSILASLLYGLVTFGIFRLLKRPQSYKTSFAVAMYSRAFATILGLLTFVIPFIGTNAVIIPLELLFIILMIKDVRKSYAAEHLGKKGKNDPADQVETDPVSLKR